MLIFHSLWFLEPHRQNITAESIAESGIKCRWARDDALDADNLLSVIGIPFQDDFVVEDALSCYFVHHTSHSTVVNVFKGQLELGQPVRDCSMAALVGVAFHTVQVQVG